MKRPVLALTFVAIAALPACGAAAEAEDASARPAVATADGGERTTLVIGSVSDDPEEEAEVFQPFIDFVAEHLVDEGVTGGEVVVAQSTEEMSQLLRDGEVDLYVDSMNGITVVVRDGTATPLLRRWKDGAPEYHSVIVARRDSGITTAEQLRGGTLAFEEETSTDGYFLAYATLRRQGLPLAALPEPTSPVAPDQIGYVFSGDDENTVFLVLDGRVDAGALSEEDLEENAGSRADELVVVARTMDVPRHGVVVRAGLDQAVVQELAALLPRLHESTDGRRLLEEFDDTARFDLLTTEALAPVMELRGILDAPAP